MSRLRVMCSRLNDIKRFYRHRGGRNRNILSIVSTYKGNRGNKLLFGTNNSIIIKSEYGTI